MNLEFNPNEVCACGKVHKTDVENCVIEEGAVNRIPEYAAKFNAKKAFIVADVNTFPLAGEKIIAMLKEVGVGTSQYVYSQKRLEPDEHAMGSLVMHFDAACDLVIGIGSGVINDICKVFAYQTKRPYIIVATAAYMDGYAARTSTMPVDRIKTTIPAKSPDVILGDLDILTGAPKHMAAAGLGDMLAKYISICEWRLSHLITGEYYCERVAEFTRQSRDACVQNAEGLMKQDKNSMKRLFEGLINCGKAIDYSGVSRPGGGDEHYFCQMLDMRGLEFGTPTASHGVQCALGTLYAIKCYQALKHITPDREKAIKYAESFDFEDWSRQLREFLGKGAEPMIALEAKEQKYSAEKHKIRLNVILENWDTILKIIDEELPSVDEFESILKVIGLPTSIEEIGVEKELLPMIIKSTKDIRDKYVLPRLLWDLGVLEDICSSL
ncbi:MAG: sn-glycerol-1-phosphate dehydrogenase [Clostridia bacterium]|nr:sn-glycerol-1-phosphate dehydrogenase [Clostridia bacterium]